MVGFVFERSLPQGGRRLAGEKEHSFGNDEGGLFVTEKVILGDIDRRTEVCKFLEHCYRSEISTNRVIMSIVRISDLL